MSKPTKSIILYFAIAGLLFELFPVSQLPWIGRTLGFIEGWYLGLNVINLPLLTASNNSDSISINLIKVALYISLVLSVIIYNRTEGKETRLLRMLLALIFLVSCISSISICFAFFYASGALAWLQATTTAAFVAATGFISITAYKALSNVVALKSSAIPIPNSSLMHEVVSERRRFFHLIADLAFSVVLCFPLVRFFVPLLSSVEQAVGELGSIAAGILICRLFYYLFFEVILKTTPAKVFGGSRVVQLSGAEMGIGHAVVRTFSRFIPFEPISIFKNGRPWHDALSSTFVVEEETATLRNKAYLTIVAGLALTGLLINFVVHEIDAYHQNKLADSRSDHKKNEMKYAINDLSKGDRIDLMIKDDPIEEAVVVIDDVRGDSLIAHYYTTKTVKYYPDGKEVQDTHFTIQRQTLIRSVEEESSENEYPLVLTVSKAHYRILKISPQRSPSLSLEGGGRYSDETLRLSMHNSGANGTVTEIVDMEGTATWTQEVPAPLETFYAFYGKHYKFGTHYKFQFSVEDSLKRSRKYEVEGYSFDATLTEVTATSTPQ